MSEQIQKSVLNQTVSMLKSYNDNYPTDVNLIEYLTNDRLKNDVLKIRSVNDKIIRSELKSKLPAVMISGKFKGRGEQNLIVHSGLIPFDIDYVEDIEDVRGKLVQSPYVAYLSLSVSGKGLFGIVAISNNAKHKEHFKAMQLYFKSIGVPEIDPAPANVCSLRGYSYDEAPYFNHNAKIFDFIYTEPQKPRSKYSPSKFTSSVEQVFEDFNDNGDIESLLVAHGWQFQYQIGSKSRYCRPGKEKGVSADYCSKLKVFFVFTNGSVFEPNKGYSHTGVFCMLECNGDYNLCHKKLKAVNTETA